MISSRRVGLVFVAIALLAGIAIGWAVRGPNEAAVLLDEPAGQPANTANVKEPEDRMLLKESPGRAASSDTSDTRVAQGQPNDSVANEYSNTGVVTQDSPVVVEPMTIPVSDAHEALIRRQFRTDEKTGEKRAVRDILESEAVDSGWSYFMAQTLQLFISSHSEASKFSVFHIECRTTMCEIQAVGFDESTAPDWSRILFDMSRESWYDFAGSGTHNDVHEGQLVILTRLFRPEHTEAQ